MGSKHLKEENEREESGSGHIKEENMRNDENINKILEGSTTENTSAAYYARDRSIRLVTAQCIARLSKSQTVIDGAESVRRFKNLLFHFILSY